MSNFTGGKKVATFKGDGTVHAGKRPKGLPPKGRGLLNTHAGMGMGSPRKGKTSGLKNGKFRGFL